MMYVQKYGYGAVLGEGWGYESHSYTLRIPGIELEEGFLIAKLVGGKRLENEIFPKKTDDIKIYVPVDGTDRHVYIRRTKNNQVAIIFDE